MLAALKRCLKHFFDVPRKDREVLDNAHQALERHRQVVHGIAGQQQNLANRLAFLDREMQADMGRRRR